MLSGFLMINRHINQITSNSAHNCNCSNTFIVHLSLYNMKNMKLNTHQLLAFALVCLITAFLSAGCNQQTGQQAQQTSTTTAAETPEFKGKIEPLCTCRISRKVMVQCR